MNLISLSIKRPIFISMITIFGVVCGILSISRLPVDLYPDVTYPVISVNTQLAGAAPEEVEEILTRPIEDVLSGIAGITSMRSISRESRATIILEFAQNSDMSYQEMQVRSKIASIRNRLPDEIDEPTVQRQDPDDTPILELVLTGNKDASELTAIARDDIAERIRQIDGVGEVSISGERTREVIVAVKPEILEDLKISIQDISRAIKNHLKNEPVGKLEGQKKTWTLRAQAPVTDLWTLKNLTVAVTADFHPVKLEDIADVSLGFAEVRRINRFYKDGDLKPAITIEVRKQSGKNTVAVSHSVTKLLSTLKATLPEDVTLQITRDNAELIRVNIADVLETLIIGAILTVLVVLLFLHSPRATLTTAISLPSSILTTFAVMALFDFSINVMTLLSLSLAIGLLVDDAIVVRENIFRKLLAFPKKAISSAYSGTKEVSLAVIATTLTIVAVFLPVGMMGGTSGKFFAEFAVTVVFAIMISLWDALTMAPMLSAYYANIADTAREWEFKFLRLNFFSSIGQRIYQGLLKFEKIFLAFEALYERSLKWLLPRPFIALFVTFLTGLATVFGFNAISKSFLPSQLGYVFSVNLNGPLALPLENIASTADEVNNILKNVPRIEYWSISSGLGFLGNAQINLTVRVQSDQAKKQADLALVRSEVRKALSSFVGYNVRISEPSDPLSGTSGRFQPVAVLITGDSNEKLKELAREVQGMMREIKGLTDILPLNDEGIPEYLVRLDPEKGTQLGIDALSLAKELRTWVDGDASQFLTLEQEQVPVRVAVSGAKHMSLTDLLSLSVTSPKPGEKMTVPLLEILDAKAKAGPAQLTRENRQKIIRVGAGLEPKAPLGDIVAELRDKLTQYPFPKGYRARIVGQNEQMDELFQNVMVALGLGCLFMYMVLASLYESFVIPIVVMLAVPLAATGAICALLLTDLPLDLYSGIGLVLLAGIVAKNSILLVDFALEKMRHGINPTKAILEAAPIRLRPILMTSIAMIVGMLPVATGLGVGGAARQGLGVATIGGILSSTFLTLIVVPNFLEVICRLSPRSIEPPMADDHFMEPLDLR